MARTKAGESVCPVCAERIVWRLSDSGALSCFCQDCDYQGYAKEGTSAKARILKSIGAVPQSPKTDIAQAVETVVTPTPKPAGAFGVFGL